MINADPSVLLACTVLYRTVDPSLNTRTDYQSQLPQLNVVLNPASTPLFRVYDPPQVTSGSSSAAAPLREANVYGPTSVQVTTATVTSDGTQTYEASRSVPLPADYVQVAFVPPSLVHGHENTKDNASSVKFEMV